MFKEIPDLRNARILISNDDGISAPGIAILEAVARELSDDVWVSAPETEQSGAGHSLSLHRPLRTREAGHQRIAVDGTPTDSVLLAINHIMTDRKPDLVLSGINRGANLADDVTYSGTVAAAMEGTLLGVPSIAFSQIFVGEVNWDVARRYVKEVIQRLAALSIAGRWQRNVLMNVNFPAIPPDDVKGFEVAVQGKRKIGDGLTERLDPRGRPYIWIGPQRSREEPDEGSDLAAVQAGYISITPLSVDLTDFSSLSSLTDISFPKEPGQP